jgi:tetratricopeptide (TPR) repeat protein
MHDYARAAADLKEVIRLDPRDADAYESLAWLLATCPDEHVRDGRKAVEYAGTACDLTGGKSPQCLGTLAAAFAEAGRFDLAVKWQQRALESAEYEKEEGQAARERLRLFEERRPYHEE